MAIGNLQNEFRTKLDVNKTELRGAFALASVYLMRMLGLFMVMPVIALLAIDYPDYSPLMVGLVIGGYGLTQAIFQIPMGMLSDKFGRKPIILFGLTLFCVGSLIAAYSETLSWMIVGRVLQGAGAIAGAVMALAADISRENQRSKVMAIIGIAIGFSFYIALVLGPVIASSGGLQQIFVITAGLAVLCIPLVLFAVPKPVVFAPTGDTLPEANQIKNLFFDRQLWRLNFGVLVLHMLIALVFVQLPLQFSQFGWELHQHWSIYLPLLVAAIFGMALLMGLKRKLSNDLILRFSILLLIVSFCGLYFWGSSAQWLIIFVWLFFSAFNYLEANFPALVSNIAPAGKKGSAMGIYASFQFFGAFLGGLLAGALQDIISAESIYLVAATVCVFWLIIFLGFHGTDPLKRYTLALNQSDQDLTEIQKQFSNLEGVRDFIIDPDESAIYLKVDSSQFNLQQARQIANSA